MDEELIFCNINATELPSMTYHDYLDNEFKERESGLNFLRLYANWYLSVNVEGDFSNYVDKHYDLLKYTAYRHKKCPDIFMLTYFTWANNQLYDYIHKIMRVFSTIKGNFIVYSDDETNNTSYFQDFTLEAVCKSMSPYLTIEELNHIDYIKIVAKNKTIEYNIFIDKCDITHKYEINMVDPIWLSFHKNSSIEKAEKHFIDLPKIVKEKLNQVSP